MTQRVAVVGLGGIGRAAHLPAVVDNIDRAEMVAVVDTDEQRLQEVADEFGADPYTDLAAMLNDAKPDLVCLATPPHTHAPLAAAAMRAGSHVWCEKPLTGSLAEVDMLRSVENETGRWCISVSQFRYTGGAQWLRAELANGRWGPMLSAVAHTMWYRPPSYWDIPWRGRRDTEYGGATVTQAYHAIDLVTWMMGGWSSVQAVAATVSRPIEVDDLSAATVVFENGGVGSLLSTVVSHLERTEIRLMAERGAFSLDTLYQPQLSEWAMRSVDGDEVVEAPLRDLAPAGKPARQPHSEQLEHILDRLANGERPDVTAAEARPTLELLTAIYKSSSIGAPVERGSIVQGDPFYDDLGGPI